MATVIHEEGPEVVRHEHIREVQGSDSGLGAVLAIIIALALVALFLFYALPLIRSASNRTVNVPGTINVNLNTPGGNNGGTQPTQQTTP